MRRYRVFVTQEALREIRSSPGSIRQMIRRAIDRLRNNPRPDASRRLSVDVPGVEVRRIRLDRWRVLYQVSEEDSSVDVLAVRKRPPYDYEDMLKLLE